MKYKWLLFDADGTLFDFAQAEKTALADTFIFFKYDYNDNYLKVYKKINSKIWDDFEKGKITAEKIKGKRFELLLQQLEIDHDFNEFAKKYLENLENGTFLIEGAEKLIHNLAPHFKIGLITNGLKKVQRSRLAKSILGNYFEQIIISEEVGYAKPNPKIFEIAFKQMNYPEKNEVLIIGDSLTSDIKGGNNFNIDTCWYNPDKLTPNPGYLINYEIQNLHELQDILR